jgi:hypothetical protein
MLKSTIVFKMSSLPLVMKEGMKATVKVRLGLVMRGLLYSRSVFTKAEFIEAAKNYLEWTDDSGNAHDVSRNATASHTFSRMFKNGNIEVA